MIFDNIYTSQVIMECDISVGKVIFLLTANILLFFNRPNFMHCNRNDRSLSLTISLLFFGRFLYDLRPKMQAYNFNENFYENFRIKPLMVRAGTIENFIPSSSTSPFISPPSLLFLLPCLRSPLSLSFLLFLFRNKRWLAISD